MDWPSQYHALLGQPAFLLFMAVLYYTYLVLKMTGPNRIIIVKGSFKLSDICDKEFHKMVQSFSTTAAYRATKGKAECSTSSTPTRSLPGKIISDIPKAKKLRLHTKDPNDSTPNKSGTPTA
jgi:hypothetical protein